jgi:hypothetical protein
MTDDIEPIDQEPEETDLLPHTVSIKTRQSFSKLRRELTEDELASAAVQRLLLDEIERLEREVVELSHYRKGFYEKDKQSAILEQRVNKTLASEMIFGVCLCVGAAALGYAPAVWNNQPSGYISIAFGLILIIGGAISRLVQR